ncbi:MULTISPECIES: hypothetical protein [Pseudomonas]|uniref:Uncharacterized protein n=1 Tax=Pseudomonas serboccidentalis TaxID=2964670 RepID=A0ABY7Z4S5_9PSED|nr:MULTISPECIES: hypothetical protein [Pseudomonas]MBT9266365.1 hypothetical protein [Pseudomonas sp. MG-9]WDR34648.1 hypothetical protein NN484_19330 [Pseudomonas serboccidentalis]
MNAVIDLHFSLWDGFSLVLVDGLQRPDSIFAAARAFRGGLTQSRQAPR